VGCGGIGNVGNVSGSNSVAVPRRGQKSRRVVLGKMNTLWSSLHV